MLQGGIVNLKKNKKPDGTLKIGALCPGAQVSIDHFESRLLCQSFNYYGGPAADNIVGGCSFVNHASDFWHVEHQVGLRLSDLNRTMKVGVWSRVMLSTII